MKSATVRIELLLLDTESEAIGRSDSYIWLKESGLPPGVAVRLKELINVIVRIGDKMVSFGTVLTCKSFTPQFIRLMPNG